MESQIIKNKEFLNILKEKLSKGNKRSIHLNVLPKNSATRIDLTEINLIDEHFSEKFIQKLFNNPKFKIDISFDIDFDFNKLDDKLQIKTQKAIKRLKSISKQNIDYNLEHGIEPFGFGFPIIYKRDKTDPKNIIKSPLLIWSLGIEENRQFSNRWTIKRDEDFPVYFNDVLISHIEMDEGIKLNSISKDFLEDSIISKDELLDITCEFISRFGAPISNETADKKVFSIVHSETIADKSDLINEKPAIIGSGVFGLYINQKQSIIEDVKALSGQIEEYKSNKLVYENFKINPFSSVATDPSQQSILNNIYANQRIIIHGPPGTGKSQSLTAIITNALSNKAKCLVVCEKRTALDVIYNNLKEVGLDQLCGVIEDTSKDRRRIVDKARDTIDDILQTKYRYTDYHFDPSRYRKLIDETKKLSDALNQLHNTIDKTIIGDSNWTKIVGQFLHHAKNNEYAEYLEKKLPNDKFEFNEDEFDELTLIIDKAIKLKSDYNQNDSKLEILNYLKFKDKQFLDVKKIFDTELLYLAKEIKDNLDYIPQINFVNYHKRLISMLSLVSKRYKLLKLYYNSYQGLISKINEGQYFKAYHENKTKFEELKLQLHEISQDIYSALDEKDKILEFVKWHTFKASLSEKQKVLIEELIASPDKIKESFIAWYFNRLLNINYIPKISSEESIPERLINLFEDIKSENSKNALTFWQQKRIDSIYRYNRTHDVLNAKQLYAKVNRDNKKKSLRQIIKQDFELFTDIFPVVLVNPAVCSSIFDLKENLFDVVIFDEASQLRIEDTFCALIRGKIRVISGDEHQMPPSSYFTSTDFSLDAEEYSDDDDFEKQRQDAVIELANKESLLEYASDLNYFDLFLDIHYRSRHPFLIDFSNAAFYGNRLTPMPAFSDYKPIRYIQVNGKYENQVNYQEAQQVIQLLKTEVSADHNGEYPSVGIATFNLLQRNLIWDEISKEAQLDYKFGNKIEKLFVKGLFIKNLENIQGDERDIVIISTTFGNNKTGVFNELFGPLNIKSKGHRLLNVIITRAKYKIYICTSFPVERIQQYKDHIVNNGNIGRGVLFAYLAYAKAIEEGDFETKDFILKLLSEHSNTKSHLTSQKIIFGTESPFEEEVVQSLIENGVDQEKIELQHQCGGFRIDIIIKSKRTNKPIIAIECDGSSYHQSNEAYVWDIFRQKQLEQYGLRFIRIWSTNWWQNPKSEIDKLVKFIQDIDNNEISLNIEEVQIKYDREVKDFIQIQENIDIDEDAETIDETQKRPLRLPSSMKDKTVNKDSIVKLLNINHGKEFLIKFSNQEHTDLRRNDIFQWIYFESPLAKSLLGHKIGDVIEIKYSREQFKILNIN